MRTASSIEVVYLDDFTSATTESTAWSTPQRSSTPIGANSFLGEFINEEVILQLDEIPEHTSVRIEFKLYTIGTWDGDAFGVGPDFWEIRADGASLLRTTFGSFTGAWQSYPSAYPASNSVLPYTGAKESMSLGYMYGYDSTAPRDATYEMAFEIPRVLRIQP
jgi:hypothetical protein